MPDDETHDARPDDLPPLATAADLDAGWYEYGEGA